MIEDAARQRTDPSATPTNDAIRAAFARLTPLAFDGLRRMVLADGSAFCFTARAGSAGDTLTLDGRSERYGAMSLIGLAQQAARGRPTAFPTAAVADHLARWAPTAPDLGDAGLVLWSQLSRGEARAEQTAAAILRRRDEPFAPGDAVASMETGFLLIGLAQAVHAGLGGPALATLAADVAARLATNQDPTTGLFSFASQARRKNLHRARMDARLGSFASQVYPTMGFAFLAHTGGDATANGIAKACAARLCALQGPEGQWWWIYHTRRAAPATRYPVYTVHQDAMGPMALLAAAIADGATTRYDPAIARSFAWFDERPECTDQKLIDPDRGVVWRAVQHDDPRTTGRLGLGRGELSRLGRAAWLGGVDRRPLAPGFVGLECRPYHLGWILLADAMHQECLDLRGASA